MFFVSADEFNRKNAKEHIYNNVCVYIYINAIFYIAVYVLQPLDLNCPHQAD